jgi:hypothetical protein
MNSRTPQYFREHAAECERLAKEAVDPHNREIFLYAAAKWRMLAAEEAGQRIPQQRDGKPLSSEG